MPKIKYIIAIIFITTFFGCTENIDVRLPSSEQKIVIEGVIESGKVATVTLTNSIPLFSSVTATNLQDFFILDATVSVSDGAFTEVLSLAIDSFSSLGLVYKGNSIIGTPGKTYSLQVITVDGKIYSSTTTIPAPIPLDSVWWQPEPPEEELGFANAHLIDPPGAGNNYKWLAKRPKDRRYIAPPGSTFDDKLVDGKSFDFAYVRGYDPTDQNNLIENDPNGQRYYYKNTDTIYIKFCTIDKASKDFYTTFEAALSTAGNPFASPTTILGNISNDALGVWAGYGVSFDTIMPSP